MIVYYNFAAESFLSKKLCSRLHSIELEFYFGRHVIGQTIIFLPCDFYLLSFFYSSPNLSGRRLDVYHTSTHGVALVRI